MDVSPLRSLAPAGAAQARRRQLAAAVLALLVVVALVVGLRSAYGAPDRDDPGAGAAVTTALSLIHI